jgi:transposase
MRFEQGDVHACRVIRIPAAEDEDARQLPRELQALRDERTRHGNRIKALLFAQGVRCEELAASFLDELPRMKTGDGRELPQRLRARLARDFARLQLCVEQIRSLEAERTALFREAQQHLDQAARREELAVRLFALRGIGDEGAWTFSLELFSWRNFRNRREVGACLGLTPLPFASGDYHSDQGLSKTGRSRLRSLCIELAWLWLQYQPDSALSQWYEQRFAAGSRRVRRIGIVALARKLMVALWKYLEQGELPHGAVLKTDRQAAAHRLTPSLTRRAKSIPPPGAARETNTKTRTRKSSTT